MDQLKCMKTLNVDFSQCYNRCEGMEIISYNQLEVDSMMAKTLSKLNQYLFNSKKPTLTKHILKLSNQYNRYKETYDFPSKYNGNYLSVVC